MSEALRILILEDVQTDAELVERALRRDGLAFDARRVDTRAAFERALEEFRPGIVLADYNLPAFTGKEALQIARRAHPEVPVVIVTGALGDEAAVELVHLGAKDYVLKNNLGRIGHAVRRALHMEEGIRARKAAERALREAEAKLRQIVEHSTNLFYSHTPDHVLTYISPQTRQFFDCEPEEALVRWTEFATDNPANTAGYERTQRAIESGVPQPPYELELAGRKGRRIWAEVREAPVVRDGRTVAMVGALTDITQRKEAESRMAASEEKFRSISSTALDAVIMADQNGRIEYWNPAAERIFGYRAEEVHGVEMHALLAPARYHADIQRGFPGFQETGSGALVGKTVEIEARRRDGTEFPAELAISALRLEDRWHAVGFLRDITERRRAEAALQRVMRAQRTLSAGNESLVRAADEQELLRDMCRVIVETGGYRAAIVYAPRHDAQKSIGVAASAGIDPDDLSSLGLAWEDNASGQGTVGKAIRGGVVQVSQDIPGDPNLGSWHAIARKHGVMSVISLPLKDPDGTVFNVLTICAEEAGAFGDDETRLFQELANDLSYGIVTLRTRRERDRLVADLLKSGESLKEALTGTIRAIALTVEKRDPYTAGHQVRVAELCVAIGRELGLAEDRVQGLRLGATIHDIGKIYVPSEILNRPGKLSKAEFEMIKSHPEVGYDIVKGVNFPWPVGDMIMQHHERVDGSGYPAGLKGEDIILEARILAVADVVEAITAHRPYRAARGLEAALAEIEAGRGGRYDAAVAEACLRLIRERRFTFSSA